MNYLSIIRSSILVGAAVLFMSLCAQPFELGFWNNINQNTNSITKAEVDWFCQDVVLNGVPCCPTGPNWHIRLWGACSPVDCDWGRLPAQTLASGYKFAYKDSGFARRYIYFKKSGYLTNALYVRIHTDFYDPARADYVSHDWFRM